MIWKKKKSEFFNSNFDIIPENIQWHKQPNFRSCGIYKVPLNASRHTRRLDSLPRSWLDDGLSVLKHVCQSRPISSRVVGRCTGSPVGLQLGKGEATVGGGSIGSTVLWTSGTMSRQGRRKTTRSCSTCRSQKKHRARGSRRSCQGSSKTSTENCAGNTERVSSLAGPLCLSLALQPSG